MFFCVQHSRNFCSSWSLQCLIIGPWPLQRKLPLFPFFGNNLKTIKVQDNSTGPHRHLKCFRETLACCSVCSFAPKRGCVHLCISLSPFFSCFWLWNRSTDRLVIMFLFFFLIRYLSIFHFELQIRGIDTSLCKGVEHFKLIGDKLTLGEAAAEPRLQVGCWCETDHARTALWRSLVKQNKGKKC